MVFAEKQARKSTTDDEDDNNAAYTIYSGGSSRAKQRGDLEEEFGLTFKPNEGEAAQHGVFFDDTQYDYMQHMRDLGSGGGAVTWVEASAKPTTRGKGKQKLEDALRDMDIAGSTSGTQESSAARSLLPEDVLPSEFVRDRTYQDQQDVPDEIAGFQPDMDPDLRQVLEALEDDAFVDDDEEIFGELTAGGYEIGRDEYARLAEQEMFEDGEGDLEYGDEDDGWESDDTIKASSPPPAPALSLPEGDLAKPPEDVQAQPPADPTSGAWLDEFKKFNSAKRAERAPALDSTPSFMDSSALSSLASGRKKKRKGARTSTTNYSMTSSALARTDHQTLLDSRFDKIEEDYAAEELPDDTESQLDDGLSVSAASSMSRASVHSRISTTSGMSGVSSYSRASDASAPQLQRTDLDSIMDEFLGGYSKAGKAGRRVKRGAPQSGMEQLDEVRRGLGPARLKSKVTNAQ